MGQRERQGAVRCRQQGARPQQRRGDGLAEFRRQVHAVGVVGRRRDLCQFPPSAMAHQPVPASLGWRGPGGQLQEGGRASPAGRFTAARTSPRQRSRRAGHALHPAGIDVLAAARCGEKAGGQIDASLPLAGDTELWAKFYQHADLYGVATPLGGFRMHGDQKTSRRMLAYIEESVTVLRRNGGRPTCWRRLPVRRNVSAMSSRPIEETAIGLKDKVKLCFHREENGCWLKRLQASC